ncbi:hypothetical protein HDU76_014085 [Blyttiomyces sp. JEL0837]|nr:hypothetical protein HDU76_014085 [Blyttiomyces sp. JEL0837]
MSRYGGNQVGNAISVMRMKVVGVLDAGSGERRRGFNCGRMIRLRGDLRDLNRWSAVLTPLALLVVTGSKVTSVSLKKLMDISNDHDDIDGAPIEMNGGGGFGGSSGNDGGKSLWSETHVQVLMARDCRYVALVDDLWVRWIDFATREDNAGGTVSTPKLKYYVIRGDMLLK